MIERLWMMSLQAAVLIGIVSILRFFLVKSPKVYSYVLWLLVLFRLLCPVFMESRFSLWPDMPVFLYGAEGYEEQDGIGQFQTGSRGEDGAGSGAWEERENGRVNETDGETEDEKEETAVKADKKEMEEETVRWPQKNLASGGKIRQFLYGLWAAGALVTAFVFLLQYVFLCRRIRTSVLEEGNVWRCEHIGTPFVMGLSKPGIYLPFELEGETCKWVLQHEKMHIRHRDNLVRAAEVFALCLHWWNPLVWYAVHKLNQDMEMFCDEAVLAGKDKGLRKEYAKILLDFSMKKSSVLLSVSFGKSNTEERVLHVLRGKEPCLKKTIGTAAVMAVLAASFLTVRHAEAAQTGAAGLKQAQMAVLDSINGQTKQEKTGPADEGMEGEAEGKYSAVSMKDMGSICGITWEQADMFFEKLIHDVTLGNQKETEAVFRKEVAAVIAYPLKLSLEGKDVQIENEEELLSYYEQIFTKQMLGRMETWRREIPFYNWQGVSWGNGALWIQMRDGEIKLAVIRNE